MTTIPAFDVLSPFPSPFPDDDTLGLPDWCPRAPDPIGGIAAVLAVIFSPTLTVAGRRFMARTLAHQSGIGAYLVSLHQALMVADRAQRPLPPLVAVPCNTAERILPPAYTQVPSATRAIIRRAEGRAFRDLSPEEVMDAIGADLVADEEVVANAVVVRYLARHADAKFSLGVAAPLLRASFAYRLPWTRHAPDIWWWPLLESRLVHDTLASLLSVLPAAFFPPDAMLRIVRKAGLSPITLRAIALSPWATPEVLIEVCRQTRVPPLDATSPPAFLGGGTLSNMLRCRRDLNTLAPQLLPVLLGHPHGELAALGLDLATTARCRGQSLL